MNLSDLKSRNKILTRIPMGNINAAKKTLVDVNANRRLDSDKDTKASNEPLLDISMDQLKAFARENGVEGLLTKECIGELNTVSAKVSNNKVEVGETSGTLTEAAQQLNPFPNLGGNGDVQWAIDPMLDNKYDGQLILFLPKEAQGGGGCG